MSTAGAKTLFAGSTRPERPTSDSVLSTVALLVGALLLAPVAVVVFLAWMVAFFKARMPWKVPAVAAVLLAGLTWVTGQASVAGVGRYIAPWRDLIDQFGDGDMGAFLAENWTAFLAAQIPLGLLIGTIAAAVMAWWRWARRPHWEHRNISVGPWLKRRVKRTSRMIAAGLESPAAGVTVGVSLDRRDGRFAGGGPAVPYGRRVVLSDKDIAGHRAIFGASGSGKTTSMLIGARDVIRQGHGCVFIDCKGGPDVPDQLAAWAHRYGRQFQHWSIHERGFYNGPAEQPSYYDPVSRGDASRRKDLLIGAQRWDVEFYKSVVAEVLQDAFQLGDIVWPAHLSSTHLTERWQLARPGARPPGSSFERAMLLLDPDRLADAAAFLRHQNVTMPGVDMEAFIDHLYSVIPVKGTQEWSGLRNMRARLHTLTASTAGAWLRTPTDGSPRIDLMDAVRDGQVVCFSLDTSLYEETAAQMAGLIVQDLKTLSSELRHDNTQAGPLHVYIDEFSAVDATNILGLLAKGRDADMPVTLATQALADLARTDDTFVDSVLGIVGSFVIHRANTEQDARVFAGLTGLVTKTTTRQTLAMTTGIGTGFGAAAATGQATVHTDEGYAVEPETFQTLPLGQCVVISKIGSSRHIAPVQVVPENALWAENMADAGDTHPTWAVWEDDDPRRAYPEPAAPGQAADPVDTVVDTLDGEPIAAPVRPAAPARPVIPARPAAPTRPAPAGEPADLRLVHDVNAPTPVAPAPASTPIPARPVVPRP